ncbi:AAA family ATPase [Pigmentiphaga aceris]|uniref:DNA 3'-5' helicase n=1 Tax=Pigmentiphaga aceris TaxID=1940612 RepID=A0A5C0B2E7_9BURK|nr:UvrD-helicase domain-containing protein [Pigmentiphaga aceris]QEI07350.1 AAA family ATPase [Pigmentiphaga aceris]
MSLLANLNPPQLAAVTLEPRHALVLAGAGSGKTRVLTTRMAWLIQTGRATPHSLLAVTFTNKAAREMLTRMSAMLPINTRGMWIGTFHGLCNRLLRAHHRDAGLPQTFQILDTADQLASIKRMLKAANVDDEKYPPKQLQQFINGNKEAGLRAGDVEAHDAFTRRMVELYDLYDTQCQREGVADFSELLLRSYELLARNAPIREHYQRRFRHILVDEFQDTNTLQYRWLKLLAGGGAAVFAVGDDDQSIYAFRGANVGNMAEFEHEFAHGAVIKLEQNYRSHGHILDTANALIQNNGTRLGKNLWTDQGHGEPIRVYEAGSDNQEAHFIMEEIRSLIGEGRLRSDIAILYRSNAQSRVVEHALFSAGVPYKVYGGLRFFERQEIKHALAYLRLMENPHDDTAWMRVANFPVRGIGARTLEQQADLARELNGSLYSAVARVPGRGGSALVRFSMLIDQMRFDTQGMQLHEVVEHVIEASGLVTHYQGEREGAERVENLRELVNAAAAFASEAGHMRDPDRQDGVIEGSTVGINDADQGLPDPEDEAGALVPDLAQDIPSPLAGFLSHAALEAGDNQASAGQDAVQLMTVHAAKGLEFDAVFITGLEEGLFPHENSILEQSGLEEERRLMYVAITRARQRLYMSFSQTRMLHGQTRYHMRSRFLAEMPDEALKWLTPKAGRAADVGSAWATSAWRDDGKSAPEQVGTTWHNRSREQGYFGSSQGYSSSRNGPVGVEVGGTMFKVGQSVAHARFGEGVILALTGSGTDAQVQVRFADVGTKTLALAMAKLTAL